MGQPQRRVKEGGFEGGGVGIRCVHLGKLVQWKKGQGSGVNPQPLTLAQGGAWIGHYRKLQGLSAEEEAPASMAMGVHDL